MMRRLKNKLVSVLVRASAIGAHQAVADVSQRIDTFARLSAEQTEFTREIAALSRRAQTEIRAGLDDIARMLADRRDYIFLGGTNALTTVDHGHRLFVDTRDRQLVPHLVTNGHWEAWNARLFRQVLRDGDRVVDAGSNVGYFVTLAAELVGRTGHVHAFEANPDIARLLTSSVEINGYASRVTVSTIAVSDRSGTAQFIAYSDRQGDGGLLQHNPCADVANGTVLDVETGSLDAALPAISNVRLMHFDIEGGEPAALRGARRIIETSPRLVLLVEWGHVEAETTELRSLMGQGFSLYVMRHTEQPKPIRLQDLAAFGLCDLLLYRGPLTELGYDATATAICD